MVNTSGVPQKNLAAAGIPTFLYGPLGMLYSTVSGAVIMFLLDVAPPVVAVGWSLGADLLSGAAADCASVVRLLYVLWRQPDAIASVAIDVLSDARDR